MRVLLMRPSSKVQNLCIPLGLLYLAATLRKTNEVRVLDARLERTEESQLRKTLREYTPDLVGISLLTVEAGAGHRDAAIVKEELAGSRVIFGGPYSSADPVTPVTDGNVDASVRGEGEETLLELVQSFSDGARLEHIKGIAYRHNGHTVLNPERVPVRDLDGIPLPAYDLVQVEKYFQSTSGYTQNMMQVKHRAMPIFTSRGCPYFCVYCHRIFGKHLRMRSPEGVMAEVRLLRTRYALEELHFSDDAFNLDRNRAKRICEGIEQDGRLALAFPNGLRADWMDEELLAKMKSAGTTRIIYAIESGSKSVQKRMRKNLDLDKAMWSIEKTVGMKINTGGFFMLGFPGETADEMQETIDFACKSRLHTASFFYVTPFPGTELYDYALKAGISSAELNGLYNDHGMDFNKPRINLSKVDLDAVVRLKKNAIRKFYFSPGRILGILRTMPNRLQIFRNALIVLKLGLKKSVTY